MSRHEESNSIMELSCAQLMAWLLPMKASKIKTATLLDYKLYHRMTCSNSASLSVLKGEATHEFTSTRTARKPLHKTS